jgi:hypothetical protein
MISRGFTRMNADQINEEAAQTQKTFSDSLNPRPLFS